MSLRLPSGELQSPTGTGCPFLAGGGLQFWLCLFLPAVMVTRAQCTGRAGQGRATLPSLLRPQFRCAQSPTAAGGCAQSSHQCSCQQGCHYVKTISRSIMMILVSSLHPPPTVAPLQPELPSPWRKLLKVSQYPATCSGLMEQWLSAYWLFFVVQGRRGGTLAAVKEPTAA